MEAVVWNFSGGSTDGAAPVAGLTMGANGVLYGGTSAGGANGGGVAFALTPPSSPGGSWTESILHSFGAYSGGVQVPLTLSGDALLGCTFEPPHSGGQLFKLTPKQGGSSWAYDVLFNFPRQNKSAPKGELVNGPLVVQDTGAIIGTAQLGGRGTKTERAGTVFRLTPPTVHGQPWSAVVLYDFGRSADAPALPYTGLVKAIGGGLFGTTQAGGTFGFGTIFSLIP